MQAPAGVPLTSRQAVGPGLDSVSVGAYERKAAEWVGGEEQKWTNLVEMGWDLQMKVMGWTSENLNRLELVGWSRALCVRYQSSFAIPRWSSHPH